MFYAKGAEGEKGKGGKGGKSTKNGKIRRAKCLSLLVVTVNVEETVEDGEIIDGAADGDDGLNENFLEFPNEPDQFVMQPHTINRYKEYVRDQIAHHPRETKLREFLDDLNNNQQIQSVYNVSGFVDELLGMEKQYFMIRNKLDFTPFVKSLRERIVEYTDHHANNLSKSDKKMLSFLQTATLSKLCSIHNHAKKVSTVDVLKYLQLMREQIQNLKQIEKDDRINQHWKQFKTSLDHQIASARDLVEKQTMPEMKRIFGEIKNEISKSIGEILNEKRHIAITKQRLEESSIKQKILCWLKISGSVVLFLCTAGAVIVLATQICDALSRPPSKFG